jgi:beta-N-acetylhexosaminidase
MASLGDCDPDETLELHRVAAAELARCGVNVNFAPVADLCTQDCPGAIGDRAFGDDPARVAAHVAAAVRGIQSEGVLACAKHFPGHGATTDDSHRVLPSISWSFDEMVTRDIVPFQAAIEAGVAAVMSAHVVYTNDSLPASLSSFWLRDVLRHKLKFDGLIVTDALEMKALQGRFAYAEAGALALHAGSDVLLYYKEGYQYEAFWELRSRFDRGEFDCDAVAASLERVRMAKRRFM